MAYPHNGNMPPHKFHNPMNFAAGYPPFNSHPGGHALDYQMPVIPNFFLGGYSDYRGCPIFTYNNHNGAMYFQDTHVTGGTNNVITYNNASSTNTGTNVFNGPDTTDIHNRQHNRPTTRAGEANDHFMPSSDPNRQPHDSPVFTGPGYSSHLGIIVTPSQTADTGKQNAVRNIRLNPVQAQVKADEIQALTDTARTADTAREDKTIIARGQDIHNTPNPAEITQKLTYVITIKDQHKVALVMESESPIAVTNARPELRLKTRLSPLQVGTDNQWPHLIPPDMATVKETTVAITISTERQASRHTAPTGAARVTSEAHTSIGRAELTMTAEIVSPTPSTEQRSSLTGEGRLRKARRQSRKHQKMLARKTYQEALAEEKRAKIKAKKLRRAIRQSTESSEAVRVKQETSHQSLTQPHHQSAVPRKNDPVKKYQIKVAPKPALPADPAPEKHKTPNGKHLDNPFEPICGEHLEFSSDSAKDAAQVPTDKTIIPNITQTEFAYPDILTDMQTESAYPEILTDTQIKCAYPEILTDAQIGQVQQDRNEFQIGQVQQDRNDILTDTQIKFDYPEVLTDAQIGQVQQDRNEFQSGQVQQDRNDILTDTQIKLAYPEILTGMQIESTQFVSQVQQNNFVEPICGEYPENALDSISPTAKNEAQERTGKTIVPINLTNTQIEFSYPKHLTDTQIELVCPEILTGTQTGSAQRSSQVQQENNEIQENLGGPTFYKQELGVNTHARAPRGLQLFVRTFDGSKVIQQDAHASVSDLKASLALLLGIQDLSLFYLKFKGAILADSKRLCSYQLEANDNIQLLLRGLGGGDSDNTDLDRSPRLEKQEVPPVAHPPPGSWTELNVNRYAIQICDRYAIPHEELILKAGDTVLEDSMTLQSYRLQPRQLLLVSSVPKTRTESHTSEADDHSLLIMTPADSRTTQNPSKLHLVISASTKTSDLLTICKQFFGREPDKRIALFHQGRPLEGAMTIKEQKIPYYGKLVLVTLDEDTADIAWTQIFIKTFSGETFTQIVSLQMTTLDLLVVMQYRQEEAFNIPAEELRIIFASRQLGPWDSLLNSKVRKEDTLTLLLRLRGGMPAKGKSGNSAGSQFFRVFSEVSEQYEREEEEKRRTFSDHISGTNEALNSQTLQARRNILLQEGEKAAQIQQAKLKREASQASQSREIREEMEVTIRIRDNLSEADRQDFARSVNAYVSIMQRRNIPLGNKHKQFAQGVLTKSLHREFAGGLLSKEIAKSTLLSDGARTLIYGLLRTRKENLGANGLDRRCPTNDDVKRQFEPIASKVTAIALPHDLYDTSRSHGTDFHIILGEAKHQLMEWTQRDTFFINGWCFDLIVDPPFSTRLCLSPTTQDNNLEKLAAFVTGLRTLNSNGNPDTRLERVLHQGLLASWNTLLHLWVHNFLGIRLEHSRLTTVKGNQTRFKHSACRIGERTFQAPLIYVLIGSHRTIEQEALEKMESQIIAVGATLQLNMVADCDKSSDNALTFSLTPRRKRPPTGQEDAQERAMEIIYQDLKQRLEFKEAVDQIVDSMDMGEVRYSREESSALIRSLCRDLTYESRSALNRQLGSKVLDTLKDNRPVSESEDEEWGRAENLSENEDWKDYIEPPTVYVTTIVTGIDNIKQFCAGDKFNRTATNHKDRDSAQMHLIKLALQNKGIFTEALTYIHADNKRSSSKDAFIAIFAADQWARLTAPPTNAALLIPLPNTVTKKFKTENGAVLTTFDGKLKVLPDLLFKPIEEENFLGEEADPYIMEALQAGNIIFSTRVTKEGTKISRNTPVKSIIEIQDCNSLNITKLSWMKRPDTALESLYALQDKNLARQFEGPAETIIWMYSPLFDALLILKPDILQELLPTNSAEDNRRRVMDYIETEIKIQLTTHASRGLWVEDTPFPNTIHGEGLLDGSKEQFPSQDPAALPIAMASLLSLSSKLGKGLSEITMTVLLGLIDADILEPIGKKGHTLIIPRGSDLKDSLLKTDALRLGYPYASASIQVSEEAITKAFERLSTHISPNFWGMVLLDVDEDSEYPHIETANFLPSIRSDDPFHINKVDSTILAQGSWWIQSQALKKLRKNKGLYQFPLKHPKMLLWLCPGKIPGQEDFYSLSQLFGQDQNIENELRGGVFESSAVVHRTIQEYRTKAIITAARSAVARGPAIIPGFSLVHKTVQTVPTPRSEKVNQDWLALPRLHLATDPLELLTVISTAKETEATNPIGVVAYSMPEWGILLTRSDQFEQAKLQTIFRDTLPQALTNGFSEGMLQLSPARDDEGSDMDEEYEKDMEPGGEHRGALHHLK